MAKTKEELNTLKQEIESLTVKLKELSEEELQLVTGGVTWPYGKAFDNGMILCQGGSRQDVIGE